MTTAEILKEIGALQAIQKTHRPTDSAWMQASQMLAPLFAEMNETMKKIQAATLAARARTGDDSIGVETHCGAFRVVSVTYPNGGARSVVTPMSDILPLANTLEFLNNLPAVLA